MIPVVQSEQTATAPTLFHGKKASAVQPDLFGKIMSQMSASQKAGPTETANAPTDLMISTAITPQALGANSDPEAQAGPSTDILGLLEQQADQVRAPKSAAPESATAAPLMQSTAIEGDETAVATATPEDAAEPSDQIDTPENGDVLIPKSETTADTLAQASLDMTSQPVNPEDPAGLDGTETTEAAKDGSTEDELTDQPDAIVVTGADDVAKPQAPQPVAVPVQSAQPVQTAQIAAGKPNLVQTAKQPSSLQDKGPVSNSSPANASTDETTGSRFDPQLTESKETTEKAAPDHRSAKPGEKFAPTEAKIEPETPAFVADKPAPIRQGDGQPILPGSTGSLDQLDQSSPSLQSDGLSEQPSVDMTADNWEDTLATQIDALFTENGGEIDIALTPDNLGSVRIRLELNDGAAQVTIVTETDQAARLFSQSEQKLSEMLAKSGMSLTGQEAGTERRQDQGNGRNSNGQTGQTGAERSDDRADVETRAMPVKGLVNLVA